MPAVGDQHRNGPTGKSTFNTSAVAANPYDDTPRMSEYTAHQIETLQNRLDKRLGPEYLSSRQGPGGQKVHYIAADKCINLANEVFGFNGWSSSIQNIQVDFVDEERTRGKVSLGLSVIMRVTLKDGTYHEDIGYGHIENCSGKAAAFEKAKKEGTTDGLKRALRTFGNVLGNCIYDKEYLSKVTRVKAIPTKWDVDQLHRHSDFAPLQKEPAPATSAPVQDSQVKPATGTTNTTRADAVPADFEGEFGSDLFDEADFSEQHTLHPDEVVLDQQLETQNTSRDGQGSQNGGAAAIQNQFETPSKPQRTGPAVAKGQPLALPPPANSVRPSAPPGNQLSTPASKPPPQPRPQPAPQNITNPPPGKPISASNLPPSNANDQPQTKPEQVTNKENNPPAKPLSPLSSQIPEKRPEDPAGGFYSARAAEALRSDPYNAKAAPAFDPRFESPSIRKTAGFNHRTSAPVSRDTYKILPPRLEKDGHGLDSNSLPPPSQSASNNAASDTNHRTNITAGPVNNAGFASPVAKPPMTTSYRPPTKLRTNASNNNPSNNYSPACNTSMPVGGGSAATAQNANGKRPPLSDMTNVTSPGGGEKADCVDPTKRTRTGDGGGSGIGPTGGGAQQQGQQESGGPGPPS